MLLGDFVSIHHPSVHLFSFRSFVAKRLAHAGARHEPVTGFVRAALANNAVHVPIEVTPSATPKTCHTHTSLGASRRGLRYLALRRLNLTDAHQLLGLRPRADGLHAAGRVEHDCTHRSSEVVTMPNSSLTGAGQVRRPERASLGSAPPQAGILKTPQDPNAASKSHSVMAELAGAVLLLGCGVLLDDRRRYT
jgi:hypothetical protein